MATKPIKFSIPRKSAAAAAAAQVRCTEVERKQLQENDREGTHHNGRSVTSIGWVGKEEGWD
jgi:hypothetical protein